VDPQSNQVQVALEFLAERGLLVRRRRLLYPESSCLYEEAMGHFRHLADVDC
jgi:hypothetical protein